jgi:branched-chain amino acid transport system substrate-binding protein
MAVSVLTIGRMSKVSKGGEGMLRRYSKLVALLLAIGLVAAACGDDDGGAIDASKEKIVIGAIFDLSGPTSDVGTPYSEGMRAYVDWRNASGGIDGHEIDLRWQDYAYAVDTAEQLYQQYVGAGAVAFEGWGTGDTEALRTRVTEDEIPFMSASYSEALDDPSQFPYNFLVGTSYSQQMRIALKWISENHDGHAEVAVFHHDSPFGTSPVDDGAAYIAAEGLDLGYQAYAMPGGVTDYVGELSQAESQGADYIVIQNVPKPASTLVKDIAAQGLEVGVICLNWCGDEILVELAGDAAEGVMSVQPFTGPSAGADGLSDIEEYLEGKGDTLTGKNLRYVQGWYTMAVMAEAIGNVIDDGDAITGPNIKAALEAMGPFSTGGVSGDIEFSSDNHSGMPGSPVIIVENGQWKQLEDVMTP